MEKGRKLMAANYTAALPMPSAPFVEPDTGMLTPIWFQFLLKLFTRTGGALGVITGGVTHADVASITAEAAASPAAMVLSWPSAAGAYVANGDYEMVLSWPWPSGSIVSLTAETGNGSFAVSLLAGGILVPGMSGIPVNSSSPVTTLAGVNALSAGKSIVLTVSGAANGVTGGFTFDFGSDFDSGATAAPTDVTLQVNYTRPLWVGIGDFTSDFSADFSHVR